MSFPNLFISSLKVIRPKEYGVIALTLIGCAFVSSSKAAVIDSSSLNEGVLYDPSKSKIFSLISSVSSSLADLSQDGTKSFDVEIMRRQKPSGLFSSCLVAHLNLPCKVTTVFSLGSTPLANTVGLEGKYLSNLKGNYNESA